MSLKPQPIEPIPDETRQIAQAAFPKGTPFMTCEMSWAFSLRMPNLRPCLRRRGPRASPRGG